MTVRDQIQGALKSGDVILGYNESIKFIKLHGPKLIVISNNLPEEMKKEVEHNAKVGKTKLEVFDGTSKELGIFCGKPFPVAVLVIK